jgi:hypothetical protein
LGAEFQFMFCLSQGQFQILIEDDMVSGNPFYINNSNQNHQLSIEAKLLMPLNVWHTVNLLLTLWITSFGQEQCILKWAGVISDLYKGKYWR